MKITDKTFVDTVFFVANNDMDWMATLFKNEGGPWEFEYRFRYYHRDADGNTGDAFDGKDKKSFYAFKAKDDSEATLAKAISALTEMSQVIAEGIDASICSKVPVRGGVDKLSAALAQQSWAHVRVSPPVPDTVM